MPKVFFVTGTSTGFGYNIIQEALDRGDYAVATARNPSVLNFANTTSENFLPVKLDITSKQSILEAFDQALERFGRVDVVINNAGYGLTGCFEEMTESQIREQMEVNFFGLLDVTREAIKAMREQKPSGGVIQQITSIGGLRGAACFSLYCASKFAVEGFTESVAQEMKPEWGIKFTCIEPGGFRTDWAGRSMDFTETVQEYDHFDIKRVMTARHGTQEGDPLKAAKVICDLALLENPPLRVVIGSDAYKKIMAKFDADKEAALSYEKLSNSTDFDA